jgi:putative sigma-54 modulation protein
MQIKIVERHGVASDALRGYVVEKTQALSRFFDRIITVDVVLSVEKERQIADFHAHLTHRKLIKAHEETSDMYASIDKAIDVLKRQLVKYKDVLQDTRTGIQPQETVAPSAVTDHKEIIRVDTFLQKPMTPEEAALQLEELDRAFLVFVNSETDQVGIIYHRRDGHYGLIEPRR